jgi:hypothetical protein
MSLRNDDPLSTAIIGFVRGEEASTALEAAGLTIRRDRGYIYVDEPPGTPVVMPTVRDISAGLIAHAATPHQLKEWAQLVLSANCIDVVELEVHRDGQAILEAVWGAAEGVPPAGETLAAARRAASLG